MSPLVTTRFTVRPVPVAFAVSATVPTTLSPPVTDDEESVTEAIFCPKQKAAKNVSSRTAIGRIGRDPNPLPLESPFQFINLRIDELQATPYLAIES